MLDSARKLLMTSVLVFIKPGMPGQLSSGAMITFSFLILALSYRPFCTSTLNSLNSMTLVAQFCTLFVGLMIALLDANPAQGEAEDRRDRAIITVMVMLINGATLVWPILIKILSGTLAGYLRQFLGFYQGCCSLYVRWCGRTDQSVRIASSMAAAGLNTDERTQVSVAAELVVSVRQETSIQPEIPAPADLADRGPESEDAIELRCRVEDLIQQPPARRLRMIRGTDHYWEMKRAGGGGVARERIEEQYEIEAICDEEEVHNSISEENRNLKESLKAFQESLKASQTEIAALRVALTQKSNQGARK